MRKIQKQAKSTTRKKKSTNIHYKISVHFERPLVQRFSEKNRVLFFGRYIDYLDFAVYHTLSNKMMANFDVLRVGGGRRVLS